MDVLINSTLGRQYQSSSPLTESEQDISEIPRVDFGEAYGGKALLICNTLGRLNWENELLDAQTVTEKYFGLQVRKLALFPIIFLLNTSYGTVVRGASLLQLVRRQ